MLKNKGILVIILTVFIDLVGVGIIIPILPVYAKGELHISEAMVGAIIGIFSLMQFVFGPILGSWSDRVGRRPVILITSVISGLSYLVFSQASTLVLLLAARALGGIGGANIGVAQAYISDVVEKENRARAFAYIGAAFGLGFIIGPFLGGLIYSSYGFEWVGYLAAAISFANVILAYRFLGESVTEKREKSSKTRNPFADFIQMAKYPAVSGLMVITLIFMASFAMMQAMSAIMWKDHYYLDERHIGYMFAFIGFMAFIIQGGLIGWFQKNISERMLLVYGNVLVATGLLGVSFVPEEWFFPLEYLFIMCMSLGMAFFTPTMSSLLSKLVSEKEQGAVLSVNQSMSSLARVVGPIVGGLLYQTYSYHTPYITGGSVLIGLGVYSYIYLKSTEKSA